MCESVCIYQVSPNHNLEAVNDEDKVEDDVLFGNNSDNVVAIVDDALLQ